MDKRLTVLLALGFVVVTVALATAILVLPPDVFWTTDGGTKLIQTENFLTRGALDVVYPAAEIDPEFRFLPSGGQHLVRTANGIYAMFPPYFAMASSIGFRMFGFRGLYLLPGFASLVCALFTAMMCLRLGLRTSAWAAAPVLIFATPYFHYAVSFWEHLPAAAFSTGAILVLLRSRSPHGARWSYFAGSLVGCSTIVREEGYILQIAITLSLMILAQRRAAAATLAGFVTAMTPAWIWHAYLYGSALGLHSVVYSSIEEPIGLA